MTIRGRYRYNDSDLPRFDARYEDRKLTKDYMDKVTYMIDVIKQQIDEIEAIRHVIPNPNEWNEGYTEVRETDTVYNGNKTYGYRWYYDEPIGTQHGEWRIYKKEIGEWGSKAIYIERMKRVPNGQNSTRYNHQNSKGSSNNYYDPKRDSFNGQMSTLTPVKKDAINKLMEINAGFVNHVQNLLGRNIGMEQEGYKEGDNSKIYEITFARVRENIKRTDNLLNSIWSQYFDNDGWCKMSCQVACQAACQLACQSCQYNTCHNQNCGGCS